MAFLSRFVRTVALPAGIATTVDLPIDGARDWCAIVANVGASPVTEGTLARSPLGGLFGPAFELEAGLPLAAGTALEVRGESEPLTTLRLVLTSAAGTTVQIEGGGW